MEDTLNHKRPAFEAKCNGLRIAAWVNQGSNGNRWLSASPSRRFVPTGSTEAQYSTSFRGVGELVVLRHLIDRTIEWMNQADVDNEEE